MNKNGKESKRNMKEILSKINILECDYDDIHYYEEFKQIKLGDEYIPYIISSFGRIFSINYRQIKMNVKELKVSLNKKGYKCIVLRFNNKHYCLTIHRLVALMFVKNRHKKKNIIINHKDGIKTNNFYLNLEWCTYSYNTLHAEKNKLAKHCKGIEHGMCETDEDTVIDICNILQNTNLPIKTISEMTLATPDVIKDIYRRKSWKHISKYYNFDNYNFGKVDISDKVHAICKMCEENLYTMREMSNITGVPYPIVKNIVKGKNYVSISSKYKIDNFDKYETKCRKYNSKSNDYPEREYTISD